MKKIKSFVRTTKKPKKKQHNKQDLIKRAAEKTRTAKNVFMTVTSNPTDTAQSQTLVHWEGIRQFIRTEVGEAEAAAVEANYKLFAEIASMLLRTQTKLMSKILIEFAHESEAIQKGQQLKVS